MTLVLFSGGLTLLTTGALSRTAAKPARQAMHAAGAALLMCSLLLLR